jgi:hypothetical protein
MVCISFLCSSLDSLAQVSHPPKPMTFRKPAAARSSRIKAQTAKQTQQSTKQQMKMTTTTVSTVLYSALIYVYPTNTCSFLFQISWQQQQKRQNGLSHLQDTNSELRYHCQEVKEANTHCHLTPLYCKVNIAKHATFAGTIV